MNKYETNYMTKTCKKNKNSDNWIIKENTHEPIIEKEKYNIVQKMKEEKKGKTRIKYQFLLKGLIYCGHCKRRLQYKINKSYDKQRYLYDSAGFICSYYYKKGCKNSTYIREKDLNEIIKNEVIKRLSLIEIDKITNKLIDYYKENDKNMQKIKEYKNKIEKLERKKSILYKKKYEHDITVEEYKTEYSKAKEEIKKYESLIEELRQSNENTLDEKRIKEISNKLKKGNCISNDFLKEIINRIELYSKNKIEITFNL